MVLWLHDRYKRLNERHRELARLRNVTSPTRFLTAAQVKEEFDEDIAPDALLKVYGAKDSASGLSVAEIRPDKTNPERYWEIIPNVGVKQLDKAFKETGISYTWEDLERMQQQPTPQIYDYAAHEAQVAQQELDEAARLGSLASLSKPNVVPDIFGPVFDDADLEAVVKTVEVDPDKFIADLRGIGRNENTTTLLKQLGASDLEIDEFFGVAQEAKDQDQAAIPQGTPVDLASLINNLVPEQPEFAVSERVTPAQPPAEIEPEREVETRQVTIGPYVPPQDWFERLKKSRMPDWLNKLIPEWSSLIPKVGVSVPSRSVEAAAQAVGETALNVAFAPLIRFAKAVEILNAMKIADRVALATKAGLEGKVGSKAVEKLTKEELSAMSGVLEKEGKIVLPKAQAAAKEPWQMIRQQSEERLNITGMPGTRTALQNAGITFETHNPSISEIVTKLDEIDARLASIPKRNVKQVESLQEGRETLVKVAQMQSGLDEAGLRVASKRVVAPEFPVKQEIGQPEAGMQEGLFGEQKVVRPKGKGQVTQVSMDDALKLEQTKASELPAATTKLAKALESARQEALGQIQKGIDLAKGDSQRARDLVQGNLDLINTEMGNRSVPFHGGAKSLFSGQTTRQLEEQTKVYQGWLDSTKRTAPSLAGQGIEAAGIKEPLVAAKAAGEVPPVEPPKPPVAKMPEPPVNPNDAAKKVSQAVSEAKPARAVTEELKHKELSKRSAIAASILRGGEGAQAFEKSKSALKGPLPQADFELDLVKFGITDADITSMFNKVRTSDLQYFQKLNTAEALNKVLIGMLPTQGDIVLLEKMFGSEFAKAIMSKWPLSKKIKDFALGVFNIPRTLQTIGDLSATMRQGVMLAVGQPVQFGKAFVAQLKAVFSSKNYKTIDDIIHNNVYADKALEHKLYLAPIEEAAAITAREEAFMGRIVNKVPVLGAIVKASERAYNTFLNTLRMETWAYYARRWEGTGKSWKDYDNLASFINHATGRGDLGKLENVGGWLNASFFSPRFIASRVQAPLDLITSTPAVRKIIARNLVAFVGAGTGALGLAKLAGAEIETDPRSADFGKIKIGNTRIDFWGGYLPYARMVTQMITGQRKVTATGTIVEVDRQNIAANFLRAKLAPVPGMVWDLEEGKTFTGEELNAENAPRIVYEKLTPMFLQDISDAIKDAGVASGAALGGLSALGIGVQTYEDNWNSLQGKLGLPERDENLPYTIVKEIYSAKDYYGDVSPMIGSATLNMLKEKKNIPPLVMAATEARDIKKAASQYPAQSPVSLNADTAKGDTYEQFYSQWQARQKITDPDELKKFDQQYPGAEKGNMSQRQYVLLQQYHQISPDDTKGREQFLRDHPEIKQNPREEYLKANPDENAKLAIWGQVKPLTEAAYDKTMVLAKELDIPDNALPDFGLPKDEDTRKAYFDYQNTVEKWGSDSAEVHLLLKQNDGLRKFMGRVEITTPIPALEIDVKNRKLNDERAKLPNEKAQKEWDTKHPDWGKDQARIQAYEQTYKFDSTIADKKIVEAWADFKSKGLTASSIEGQLARVDNPDLSAWGERVGPTGEAWQPLNIKSVDALRLKVANKSQDAIVKGLPTPEAVTAFKLDTNNREYTLNTFRIKALEDGMGKKEAEVYAAKEYKDLYFGTLNAAQQAAYLKADPAYAVERFTEKGTKAGVPEKYLPLYIQYEQTPSEGTDAEKRFLQSNPDYYRDVYLGILNKDAIDFTKVASEKFETTYKSQYKPLETTAEREYMRYLNPEFDAEGVAIGKWKPLTVKSPLARQLTIANLALDEQYNRILEPAKQRAFLAANPTYAINRTKISGLNKGVPESFINEYVVWQSIPAKGYALERWMMTHLNFYNKVYKVILGKPKLDFRNIPSEAIEKQYNEYSDLRGARKTAYLKSHSSLRRWLEKRAKARPSQATDFQK